MASTDLTADITRPRNTPISRRRMIKVSGAAVAASSAFSMPYVISRSAAQAEPLTFWQFYSEGAVGTQAQWFETMVEAWNAENETQVRLEFIPPPSEDYYTKLSTAFAAGEGPDIFLLSPSDFLRYANNDALQDLTPFLEEEARTDFYEGVMTTRIVDGKILALPMEVEPIALYYSVQAFQEVGLTEADIPQTWDQLLEVGERLTTGDRYGLLFETRPGGYQVFMWYPWMWMGGGDVTTPDGLQSNFNHPGTVQGLRFWQETIEREIAPREALGPGSGDVIANLVAGYCAIQNTGIWSIAALRENAPDFEYGVFKLPVPPDGTYTTDAGGWAFAANARGQNPEAAAQFIIWAIGSMQDDSVQRVVDWCTEAKSDMPPRQSVLERATEAGAYAEGTLRTFAEEILPGARGEPRTPPEVWQLITDAIQSCQLGGADPAQQAEETSQQIEEYLATYEGARIL